MTFVHNLRDIKKCWVSLPDWVKWPIFRNCYTIYCSMKIYKHYMRPQNAHLAQSVHSTQPTSLHALVNTKEDGDSLTQIPIPKKVAPDGIRTRLPMRLKSHVVSQRHNRRSLFVVRVPLLMFIQRCPVRKLRNTGIREKIVRNHVLRRYFS